MSLTKTAVRVEQNTSSRSLQSIAAETEQHIRYYRAHPEQIPHRLRELDKEWDIERALETGSSCLSLAGLILGMTHNKKWFALPMTVQAFFLQHALQGWCPPLPILRKLGFRTMAEINREREALKSQENDAKRK